ncbi:MAG: hypothetical protein ACREMP_03175 [Candidatus Tyrphobacter sp.]
MTTAIVVAACGRQVTFPKYASNGGLQAGFMTVRFTVAAPFAFSTYDYIIVFNTTGNGITPLPNVGAQDNYAGFSDAIVVSGNTSGAVAAVPVQYVSNGTTLPPTVYPLTVPAQDIIFNVNSNGGGTQFEVQFPRSIFSSLVSPSPGASPIPSSKTWLANCFVTSVGTVGGSETTYAPVDSLGQGGGNDNTYVFSPPMVTTTAFDQTYNAQAQNAPAQSAVIESCEFANNP